MTRNFDKKLLGYAAVASTAAFAGTHSAQAMLVTNSFTGVPGNGGTLNDAAANPFLSMGNDSVSSVNGSNDKGVHLYVTTSKDKDSASYLSTANTGSGVLANLFGGAVIGPNSIPTGTAWESTPNGTDNDIAYIDTTSGNQYVPTANQGGAADQFSIGNTGDFGFFFTPGSTTFYGYAQITYDANGNTSVTYTYDNTGAAVTVPEPATLSILALGAVGLLRRTRREPVPK